jgi:threonine/homoserine/homoserine lactone efflux protein
MGRWGIVLIACGVVYLIKPDIFQRWFWKRTSISQRLMTPEHNKVYMRVLGGVFILVGIVLLIISKT